MPLNATDVLGSAGDVRIPAGVDATTPDEKQMYAAALEFERFFVLHLMKQMDAATKAMKDDSGGDAGTSGYQDMVTDNMTQAVLDGGGMGLASMLYNQLSGKAQLSAATRPAAGATPPATAPATTATTPPPVGSPTRDGSAAPAAPTTSYAGRGLPGRTDETRVPGAATSAQPAPSSGTPADTRPVTHVRGFFADPTSHTGWSFRNQWGDVAQGVHAPNPHNRIVDASGKRTIGGTAPWIFITDPTPPVPPANADGSRGGSGPRPVGPGAPDHVRGGSGPRPVADGGAQ